MTLATFFIYQIFDLVSFLFAWHTKWDTGWAGVSLFPDSQWPIFDFVRFDIFGRCTAGQLRVVVSR